MTIDEKIQEKREDYRRALGQFREVLAAYTSDRVRILHQAALMQMFEVVSELAWKTLRDVLRNEGVEDIDTPRAVLKAAYAAHFVEDGDAWMRVIDDRNNTSHIYDEETAQKVPANIERDL